MRSGAAALVCEAPIASKTEAAYITVFASPAVEEQIDIDALKAGDEQAFRMLVEQYQDCVYNTCLGFLDTVEEAEDAAQETFIEVHCSIGQFRGESKLSTWIYRIAVTKALQAIRKKKRKKRFALFTALINGEDASETVGDPDPNTQPFALLENKERAEALAGALKALPESQRIAFTLQKVEGLDTQEICDVMNLSLSAVEALLHRARANLRKHLNSYYRTQRGDHAS